MAAPKIVAAAITRYDNIDETRFRLACKMARGIHEAGYAVVFNDSSRDEVRRALREAGAIVHACSVEGMGPGRRESIERAMLYVSEPTDIIIMTEPIIDGTADMVIASRSEKSWQSFPWFQTEEEKIADIVYRETTGINADPFLGPVPFRADFARYFTECRPLDHGVADNYINIVAPILAFYDGVRVQSVEIDFIYPPEQKAEEEGPRFAEMVRKRLWQQRQLIETFFTLGKALKS